MKTGVIIIIVQLGIANILWGCGCNGPVNELKYDIDSSDAIFIGVVNEINHDHIFHLANEIGTGFKFINFDILKSYKGLNEAQLKVTVFDFMSNSSCEGFLFGKEIGDTVLVFAKEFKSQMLGSYLCGRHPTFQNLSTEEAKFIDTTKWIDPKTKYINAEDFLNQTFPQPPEQVNKNQRVNKYLIFIISLSIGLNIIFGLLLLKARGKNI